MQNAIKVLNEKYTGEMMKMLDLYWWLLGLLTFLSIRTTMSA